MATVTHKVVRGDTLSALAKRYGTTVNAIAKLNNIANVNRIYVGQVLYISGKPSSSSSSSSGSSSSSSSTTQTKATITAFGLQSDTDRTIFAVWSWGRSHTDKYMVEWDYYTANGKWFQGNRSEVKQGSTKDSVYNAPSNATKVRFRVKPVSTKYTSNKKEVSYWTASWTSYKEYNMNSLPPQVPGTPKVEVVDYKLTARLDNLDVNGDTIEFQIVKNDSSTFKSGKAKIVKSSASFSCSINVGDKYKVRARTFKGTVASGWSQYSDNVSTKPSAPSSITSCIATSETSVKLIWTKVQTATKYDIEYTTKKEYFDGSNEIKSITGILTTQYEITGLTMGERYFFRVRAVNEKGESGWTSPVTTVIGTKPSAPTTWSSTSTAITGEDIILYWVHNSEDNSKETYADLEIYIDDVKTGTTIKNPNPDEENKTSQYIVKTGTMVEGAVLRWRVRTSGVTEVMGDWSVERTINVYAPPTLSLEVLNSAGEEFTVLESFPFYLRGYAGPDTQNPISFHVSIVAKQTYETVDEIGNVKMVIEGDEVFSRFYDISEELMIEIMPGDVDLQNGIDYDLICTVSMDSGLSAEETFSFSVSWLDETVNPNAEITIDEEILAAHIRPYCSYFPDLYYKVVYENEEYVRTNVILNPFEGISVDNAYTAQGDVVYSGMYNNELTHFCILPSDVEELITDVTLSVYRREFDGKFTEIGKGLKNEENTFVTDPHPALDFARYRIVAISNSTGSVSYTDLTGVPVQEKAVIIQWNEDWSTFDATPDEDVTKPSWSGSMLKLPYNIDVSDTNQNDVSLVNYIGRSNPVSYYGTQIGATSTWAMAIPAYDTVTLYGLRRLAVYLGDVYVREPSGTGYWANVTVSYSQTHKELIIPITLSLTRVDGGA